MDNTLRFSTRALHNCAIWDSVTATAITLWPYSDNEIETHDYNTKFNEEWNYDIYFYENFHFLKEKCKLMKDCFDIFNNRCITRTCKFRSIYWYQKWPLYSVTDSTYIRTFKTSHFELPEYIKIELLRCEPEK